MSSPIESVSVDIGNFRSSGLFQHFQAVRCTAPCRVDRHARLASPEAIDVGKEDIEGKTLYGVGGCEVSLVRGMA